MNEYQHIEPLREELADPELPGLTTTWHEHKASIENNPAFDEFLKKLKREWAIETGIIERLYTWDRGVTEMLIEQGIDAALIASQGHVQRDRATQIKNLIDDQYGVIDFLFTFIKGERPFSEFFINDMHAQLARHQDTTEGRTPDGQVVLVPLSKGTYKLHANNPTRPDGEVHAYCPPAIVRDEMEQLVRWYEEYAVDTPPEILSAWLHHRFTQIHPFQDGNGRVARALASLVFLKVGLFPLVVRDEDRKTYIESLEAADAGDLSKLISLFARRQRDEILRALNIEQHVERESFSEQIRANALQILKDRLEKKAQRYDDVFVLADRLRGISSQRLEREAAELNQQLPYLTPPDRERRYGAHVREAGNGTAESAYYKGQIIGMARKHGYYAATERFRSWIRLAIFTEGKFDMVISFHGYGRENTGVMVASAFALQRVQLEDGETENPDVVAVSDLFQFNYVEPAATSIRRFEDWLEDAVAIALECWRKSL